MITIDARWLLKKLRNSRIRQLPRIEGGSDFIHGYNLALKQTADSVRRKLNKEARKFHATQKVVK